jgi:glycine dehydrogenase subunit 1
MSRYTAVTDSDRAAMLDAIGVASVDQLFDEIPQAVRRSAPLALPDGLGEAEVYAHLRELAARNTSVEDEISFLGAGMYDHYVPAVIDMLMGRSEFLTPYTPYQPEISQGGLQVMFEYQTAICELTGMDVSNASVYEGPSALAAAAYLAKLTNGRPRLVISRGVHPHARETLNTLSEGYGMTVDEIPLAGGVTDLAAWSEAIDDSVGAVFVAQPNFLGAVEDLEPLIAAAREHGALVVCSADPLALGILEAPGVLGVDVCVGEGQTLGNRLDFGGPSFGFFAARDEHVRRMPGRIAGETVDVDGRRGFVLTLQTREQHIRREKATSNICTAQALNALAGVVYLSWLGREGLVELGELLVQRTAYARSSLAAIDGVTPLHAQPVVREFAVGLGVSGLAGVKRVIARCAAEHVNPGHPLAYDYPEYADGLLVAVTEQRSRADIDRLAEVLARAVAAERAHSQTPGASAHEGGDSS